MILFVTRNNILLPARPKKVSAVGVAAEEWAASEAAAFSGNLRQDFCQGRRPQKPEPVGFSIVFLKNEEK